MLRIVGLLSAATLALAACGPTEEAPAPKPHALYDAKTFYDTTTVSMASPTPLAFSPDGANLLVAIDKSGEGAHWLSDVMAGAALGYSIGRFVAHKRKNTKWRIFPSRQQNALMLTGIVHIY